MNLLLLLSVVTLGAWAQEPAPAGPPASDGRAMAASLGRVRDECRAFLRLIQEAEDGGTAHVPASLVSRIRMNCGDVEDALARIEPAAAFVVPGAVARDLTTTQRLLDMGLYSCLEGPDCPTRQVLRGADAGEVRRVVGRTVDLVSEAAGHARHFFFRREMFCGANPEHARCAPTVYKCLGGETGRNDRDALKRELVFRHCPETVVFGIQKLCAGEGQPQVVLNPDVGPDSCGVSLAGR